MEYGTGGDRFRLLDLAQLEQQGDHMLRDIMPAVDFDAGGFGFDKDEVVLSPILEPIFPARGLTPPAYYMPKIFAKPGEA